MLSNIFHFKLRGDSNEKSAAVYSNLFNCPISFLKELVKLGNRGAAIYPLTFRLDTLPKIVADSLISVNTLVRNEEVVTAAVAFQPLVSNEDRLAKNKAMNWHIKTFVSNRHAQFCLFKDFFEKSSSDPEDVDELSKQLDEDQFGVQTEQYMEKHIRALIEYRKLANRNLESKFEYRLAVAGYSVVNLRDKEGAKITNSTLAQINPEIPSPAIVHEKLLDRLFLLGLLQICLLYTSPSPRDRQKSRMPSSA